ncbi:MAG: fibronectin/fibrinogen-binding protein [Lachnospira sp.]|nr:fibronectin/fibrinogen-binding protein [Lachnospira sp.]
MAFDGIVISNLVSEFNSLLLNGRLYKIAQPEGDELLLTIKNDKSQYRLLISANPSLPLIYLTDTNKPSPLTAPNFCMLLRKHLNNGRIISISQPGLERIIDFEIEHLNEMGDICRKHLIVEIMGKHSNIIFCDSDMKILDSIKRVSAAVSSIREVLPGRDYFIPSQKGALNPLTADFEAFKNNVFSKATDLKKAIYTSFTGISPIIAEEICQNAGIDSLLPANTLNENEHLHIYNMFSMLISDIKSLAYTPNIVYDNDIPKDFSALKLNVYSDLDTKHFTSISEVINAYYITKSVVTRIRQKSFDLRKIVSNALERNYKKLDLQQKQLADTNKRDKYRIYGELLNTYMHSLTLAKEVNVLNYYTNEEISIPLDETLSIKENAQKYFEKYNKLKRTFEALSVQTVETNEEIRHLESINTALDIALSEEDLVELKEELILYGYIKRKSDSKKQKITSKPFHYISSDGFHMYVGKNNFQNDYLTFDFATENDWWFHAKAQPGSHVIVKTENKELPDSTFEEAAALAAYYSKGRDQEKVEIDYTQKKNIKKPNQAKPGFVVYYTNYSMNIKPDSYEELKA